MSTFRKALFYTAALIGGYLAVVHFKGVKTDVKAGGGAGENIIKTLQGR